ncbi:MAG: hypothetical protein AAB289_12345 [Chloroflexota bacterium]
MTTQQRLHRIVDELPESEEATAERVLEALKFAANPLGSAPLDDEPTTDDDRAAIAEGWAQYNEGRGSVLRRT